MYFICTVFSPSYNGCDSVKMNFFSHSRPSSLVAAKTKGERECTIVNFHYSLVVMALLSYFIILVRFLKGLVYISHSHGVKYLYIKKC